MSLKKRLQKTVDFYLWCIFFKMTKKKERERAYKTEPLEKNLFEI